MSSNEGEICSVSFILLVALTRGFDVRDIKIYRVVVCVGGLDMLWPLEIGSEGN